MEKTIKKYTYECRCPECHEDFEVTTRISPDEVDDYCDTTQWGNDDSTRRIIQYCEDCIEYGKALVMLIEDGEVL